MSEELLRCTNCDLDALEPRSHTQFVETKYLPLAKIKHCTKCGASYVQKIGAWHYAELTHRDQDTDRLEVQMRKQYEKGLL